jgi:hypothetical protein
MLWSKRDLRINGTERTPGESGMGVIKFLLDIGEAEQAR